MELMSVYRRAKKPYKRYLKEKCCTYVNELKMFAVEKKDERNCQNSVVREKDLIIR